jgi:hypothetical protein
MRRLAEHWSAVIGAAGELRAYPGVVGVFWGRPRREGEFRDELALCAHVRQKRAGLPTAERIPRQIGGFSTDVIEVGASVCHARLDTTDAVRAAGTTARRRSAISIIAALDDTVVALVSGHGALPLHQAKIERKGRYNDPRPGFLVQDTGGSNFGGEVLEGEIGGSCDYAVAVFPGLGPSDAFLGHLYGHAPFRVRRAALSDGDVVEHYGTVRGRAFVGTVVQRGVDQDGLDMILPDGTQARYVDLIVVKPDADQDVFSVAGESGSLVFDAQRHAVGTLVGSTGDGGLSYVLPLAPGLRNALGAQFALFFKDE